MKKGIVAPLIAVTAAAGLLLVPLQGYAGVQQDLQRQIDQIAQQEAANQRKQQEADKKAEQLKGKIELEKKNYAQLKADIEQQGKQLEDLNKQLGDVNKQLNDAAQKLGEAEKRVESRDSMLRSRVRLMYMNGSVSYMEVLLSATSFGDFIERFQNLKTIVTKDEEILEANIHDKETIALEKKEIEKKLSEVKGLYAQAEAVKQNLQKQEKQKEVAIASLSKQEKDAEEISEEAEKAVENLVKQKQALRNKLLEEQRKEAAAKSGKAPSSKPAYSGGKLAWPVPASTTITSEFGYRIDPIAKVNKLHKGMDIAAPKGTTIVAADDGTVILASWVSGYGNTVVIDHDNGLVTWYGHMSAISVSEGDTVKRGSKVGEVGSTGDSTGNHLHFEVRTDAGPQNPRPYVGL
ncbi:murein hydrolase activator EnvC family protein [Gorillibacterium sp. sgz5001074]|uniref:murein hydrolase activator EnvC family protein n=1 Tax=Gorillibacterium sp. sgz5001074 TaxID=3446695 RepID=UPI003F665568